MGWEWTSITAICAIVGLLSSGGTYFFTAGQREATESRIARSAENLAQACLAKLELISARLTEHEKADAAQFAELKAIVSENTRNWVAAETRLAKALDDVRLSIDRMSDRLDRYLEHK